MQKLIQKAYAKKEVMYLAEWKVQEFCGAHKKIFSIKCADGTPCANRQAMWDRYADPDTYHRACSGCCKNCYEKLNCKAVCQTLRDAILEERRKQRAANKEEKEKQKAKDDERISQIQDLWTRFGEARRAANVGIKTVCETLGQYYSSWKDESYENAENGEAKLTTYSDTPYSGAMPQGIADLAELFGVSLEYLFCKTDSPSLNSSGIIKPETWQPGWNNPKEPGMYWTLTDKFDGGGGLYYWSGAEWQHPVARIGMTPSVLYWAPCPPLPEGIWGENT